MEAPLAQGNEPACNAGDTGDMGSVPRLGRSSGEGKGNSLQNYCLENSLDSEAPIGLQGVGHD